MGWTAEQYGKRFFEEICSRDLEGIVGKKKLSIYKDHGQRARRKMTSSEIVMAEPFLWSRI